MTLDLIADLLSRLNKKTQCSCKESKAVKDGLCFLCYRAKAYNEGYKKGSNDWYTKGYYKGQDACVAAGKGLDQSRIRDLISLCHPDKHNGSEKANKITQWLLSKRQ